MPNKILKKINQGAHLGNFIVRKKNEKQSVEKLKLDK